MMWLALSCIACLLVSRVTWSADTELVYIRAGEPSQNIPCAALGPDEQVSLLYWYKGDTLAEALKSAALARYDSRVASTNFTASDRYKLTEEFGLVIQPVGVADSGRYWCRVVRQIKGEQVENSVDVVAVVVVPRELTISPCSLSGTDVCEIEASRRLIVECSVSNAFPRPDLTWSVVECLDNSNQSQRWFVAEQRSSFDEDNETYSVSREIYLGHLELLEDDDCAFECVATGEAIVNRSSSVTVVVLGVKNITPTKDINGQDGDGGGKPPRRKPNLGLTAVIIVLAFISLVCLIGIVYLMSRVWCRRQRARAADEIEMSKSKDDHDEKMCLLNAETDKESNQDISGELTHWRYKGKLSKKHRGTTETLKGVTAALPWTGGGLLVATQSGLECFSSAFVSLSVKEDSEWSKDNIISIANHPNSDNVIVGLESGGLVFLNVLTGKTRSVFPNEVEPDSQFNASEVAVDDAGAIFAGGRNEKAIYMMETSTAYMKRYKIDINLAGLAAYGARHVFVSNGWDTIQKYHFKRGKGGYDMLKFKNKISINPIGSFGIRHIAVRAGLLYALNGYETGCRILQYDVETFDILQTFNTSLSDLKGLCFFGEFKVALYETNAVKIYEKGETDKLDNYNIHV